MERDGWIIPEERKGIHLTEAGREAARSVVRRHMLTEWMLAHTLKVPWSHIHNEAHHIEHTISDEIEAPMRDNLDDPQLCPHGNPLPGYEHVAVDWIPLIDVVPVAQVIIHRIHETAEDNPELLYFLERNEIVPGILVEVAKILSFNQTVTLHLGERKVIVGFQAVRNIFVAKV